MNETEFNLLDEPWIRVMDDNCQIKEVSLTDALLNAHKYKALKGEMPTQDIVILRLMLAIVHTVFSRVDADGNEAELEEEDDAVDRWESLWNNRKIPEKPVREYFEKWHERFWLFHPERPFGQMAGLTYGTEYGASKLNGEISESGNKTRIFSAYSGEQKNHLTYAQAARWLLYVNSFDDTSAKPTKEGKAIAGGKLPSPGAGWLGKLGIVYLNGKNLFETLMLNLVLINNDNVESEEHPLWERDVPPTSERREIPYPTNLAELYTLQSRRMLLKREENYVIGYYLIGGDFFAKENAFVEPMTVWRTPSKTSDPYNPKRHDSAKQMWREFSVLYDNADNNHVAGIIKWFKFISSKVKLPIMNTAIVSVQYGDKDFFVQNVFGDSLEMNAQILSEVGRGYREEIKFEISRLDDPDTYPMLQSDTTTNYIKNVIKTEADITASIEHYTECYDTYKCKGLPAGPICNPGMAAINAVLEPKKTDYYYFCNNLKTGETFYAKTLDEHEENLVKAGLAKKK